MLALVLQCGYDGPSEISVGKVVAVLRLFRQGDALTFVRGIRRMVITSWIK